MFRIPTRSSIVKMKQRNFPELNNAEDYLNWQLPVGMLIYLPVIQSRDRTMQSKQTQLRRRVQ